MLELVKNYGTLLSFLKISSITRGKLQSILKLAKIDLDANVVDVIVDMVKAGGEAKGTDSLIELLKDPGMVTEISGLIEKFKQEDDVNLNSGNETMSYVHIDSLIVCPHCSKRVHIRSAAETMKQAKLIENTN